MPTGASEAINPPAVLENRIKMLEQALLFETSNKQKLNALIDLLNVFSSHHNEQGKLSRLQSKLQQESVNQNWTKETPDEQTLASIYAETQTLLADAKIDFNIPITQLFMGRVMTINGQSTQCGKHIDLFKKQGAISTICFDCYKVQILPTNLVGLLQTFLILKSLDLPRDNTRKCMVELRPAVKFPYKGYIYCQSEEEASECLNRLNDRLRELGLTRISAKISHGCSEYGLQYPTFKFSEDGTHRNFKPRSSWKRKEEAYFSSLPPQGWKPPHFNHEGLTLRDALGIFTWVYYARLIGDPNADIFSKNKIECSMEVFTQRASEQSQQRYDELLELDKVS